VRERLSANDYVSGYVYVYGDLCSRVSVGVSMSDFDSSSVCCDAYVSMLISTNYICTC